MRCAKLWRRALASYRWVTGNDDARLGIHFGAKDLVSDGLLVQATQRSFDDDMLRFENDLRALKKSVAPLQCRRLRPIRLQHRISSLSHTPPRVHSRSFTFDGRAAELLNEALRPLRHCRADNWGRNRACEAEGCRNNTIAPLCKCCRKRLH